MTPQQKRILRSLYRTSHSSHSQSYIFVDRKTRKWKYIVDPNPIYGITVSSRRRWGWVTLRKDEVKMLLPIFNVLLFPEHIDGG